MQSALQRGRIGRRPRGVRRARFRKRRRYTASTRPRRGASSRRRPLACPRRNPPARTCVNFRKFSDTAFSLARARVYLRSPELRMRSDSSRFTQIPSDLTNCLESISKSIKLRGVAIVFVIDFFDFVIDSRHQFDRSFLIEMCRVSSKLRFIWEL